MPHDILIYHHERYKRRQLYSLSCAFCLRAQVNPEYNANFDEAKYSLHKELRTNSALTEITALPCGTDEDFVPLVHEEIRVPCVHEIHVRKSPRM